MAEKIRKILVFGKNGQVASSLAKLVSIASHEGLLAGGEPAEAWVFVGSEQANFENPESVIKILDAHLPRVIINCAAYTAVDKAESEQAKAIAINGHAPGVIGDWCVAQGASLIHFSTDYVYPGTGEAPWREVDPVAPVNEYGKTKLQGETKIVLSGCHHLILRTSWIYAPEGNNFVRTMLRLGAERETLGIVGDQVGSPSSAIEIARAVLAILEHSSFRDKTAGGLKGREDHAGVFHLAGAGVVSWYDFALEIFAKARALGLLVKVKEVRKLCTDEYPTPAKRPLNSRLDQEKIKKQFGWTSQPWRDSLAEVLEEIFVRDVGR